MSRARILADYVSSGDELALKAPLASPAFTGTPTGITAAHITSGVLPVGVTGGSGLDAVVAGKVVKFESTPFHPAAITSTSTSYASTSCFAVFEKTNVSNRLYVTFTGGLAFVSAYSNATLATMCQTSDSSTFTPSTTYDHTKDPSSQGTATGHQMQEIYMHTNEDGSGPWTIAWYFASTGDAWEGFRLFHKVRTSGRSGTFNQDANYWMHLTIYEIAQ